MMLHPVLGWRRFEVEERFDGRQFEIVNRVGVDVVTDGVRMFVNERAQVVQIVVDAPKIIVHLLVLHPGGSTFDGTAPVTPSSGQHFNGVLRTSLKKWRARPSKHV